MTYSYICIFLLIASTTLIADIRKNKIVQESAVLSIKNKRYNYTLNTIFENPQALQTAADIFYERYKNEKLDGIVIYKEEAYPLASILAYLLKTPLIFLHKNNPPPLKKNGRYLIGETVIEEALPIQNVLNIFEKCEAFAMEIFCFTEILHFKARENIQAQIMSIFLDRKTTKEPD